MSLSLDALARSTTETVPGPSLETSPTWSPGRIAAPYGKLPVLTYLTALVRVSTTAAASARFSGTSSVWPSEEMARRSGQDSRPEVFGGKFSGGDAEDGGGTGMVPISRACPPRLL